MRITKKHLLEDFERFKQRTEFTATIEWAGVPHRPRIHLEIPSLRTGEPREAIDLSPRLTMSDMHLWMEAFVDGFDHGWDAHTNFSEEV